LRAAPEPNAVLERAPALVEIYFTEALEPSFSSIQVLNSAGNDVDNADSRVDAADPTRVVVTVRALPPGVYTVIWQALSTVDGHLTRGSYPFAVGNVSAEALTTAATRQIKLSFGELAARWLTYLAMAVFVGYALFQLAIWGPSAPPALSARLEAPARRLLFIALSLFFAAQALALLVHAGQAITVEIVPPWHKAVSDVLFFTRYGALWAARFMLGLGLLSLELRVPRWKHWGALGLATAIIISLALASHAAADAQPLWPLFTDGLHALAASAWVGGLIYFGLALFVARPLDPPLVAQLIRRFSALAICSVATLILSGTLMSVWRVGSFSALTGTLYGQTLLGKLTLALGMLALGAVNLLVISSRMSHGDVPLVMRFQRLLSGEITLGLAVLLSVSLLTALPPAQTTLPTLSASTTAEDLSLTLDITPGRVGYNTFTLHDLAPAKEVLLRFTPAAGNLPPAEAQLTLQATSAYTTQGSYLSLPGAWQVQAVVRREGKFDVFANFDINLDQGASTVSWPWSRLVGGFLLGAAFACAVGVYPLRRVAWVLPVVLFVSGLSAFTLQPPTPRVLPLNPIPPNAQSIARGQALYQANCVPCHGLTGQGDGPVGLTLNPRPADLTRHTAPGVHPDGQLYEWISNGFPGSSLMPLFDEQLTDDERWHLVNYIRTLAVQR